MAIVWLISWRRTAGFRDLQFVNAVKSKEEMGGWGAVNKNISVKSGTQCGEAFQPHAERLAVQDNRLISGSHVAFRHSSKNKSRYPM